MESILQGLIDMFGIGEVPTSFPEFMYFLCVVCAGLTFVRIVLGTLFGIYKKMMEVSR